MARVELVVSRAVQAAFDRAAGKISDLSPALRPIGERMASTLRYNIRNISGQLSAATRQRDRYKDKTQHSGRKGRPAPANRRALIMSGGLINDIRFDYGKDWVSGISAGYHSHFFVLGTKTRPYREDLNFLYLTDAFQDTATNELADWIVDQLGELRSD